MSGKQLASALIVLAAGLGLTATSAPALSTPQVVSVLSVSGPALTDPPNLFSLEGPPPVGARFFFNDTLYAWSGTRRGSRVGRIVGMCTLAEFSGARTSSCTATAFLPAGQILIAGSPPLAAGPLKFVVAVLGGTGRYSNARGWARIRDISGGRSSIVFHLVP